MSGSAAPAGQRPSRSDRGFSFIEVIVAMVILAFGVLTLAGTTAYIVRQVTLADLTTERTVAFQSIVEQLQSMPYDQVTSGETTVGVYAVSWTTEDNGSQNKTVTIVTEGPGMSSASGAPFTDPSVADTFSFRLLRR